MAGRSGKRTRIIAPIILVGLAVAAVVAAMVYFRYAGAYHELTQAHAILAEAGYTAPGPLPGPLPGPNAAPANPAPNATEADLRSAVTALMPSSATHEISEPADRLLSCLSGIRTSPPWFDKDTLADVSQVLEKLRKHERSTPDTEALDPATHTQDELRATVCAQLRASKAVQYLRDFGRTPAPAHTPRQPANTYGAEGELLPCLGCALADGDAQEAVSAYLEITGVNSHTYLPDYISERLDGMLPAILDLFPTEVPDAVARRLLAALETPVDLEQEKQRLRLQAAQKVEDNATDRNLQWRDAAVRIFLSPTAVIRNLTESHQATAGLISAVDRALPLVDSPPYQVARNFESLFTSVPRSAREAQSILYDASMLCRQHHKHIAMAAIARSSIALKKHKAEHGRYPDTLDGLTPDPIPALPIDPMTGQPLRYAIEGEGFAITSSTDHNETHYLSEQELITWHAAR